MGLDAISDPRTLRVRLLVRAYLAARFRRDRIIEHVHAAFEGLWLGLFDRASLDALDERVYRDKHEKVFGGAFQYFDAEYNAAGLFDWESCAIDEHFPAGGKLVVTGAGGGREVLALLDRGYEAVGYEPNERFVEAGSAFLASRGYPGCLQPIERDAFPSCDDNLDAIVVGWGSYTLIPGRNRRVAFLQDARRQLKEGAPLLVSYIELPARGAYFRTLAGVANAVRVLFGRERVEVGDALLPNYVHHFAPREVESELRAGGFELVMTESKPYAHAVARAV
jgi:SAM-dependent methyltransferase